MPYASEEELLKNPPPPRPGWIQKPQAYGVLTADGGPLIPSREYQIAFREPDTKGGRPGKKFWFSNPGPQTHVLMSPFDETVIGGSRGGGKSEALIAWFGMGDPRLSKDDPAHYSFLLEPTYRGLMLRKEYQSMSEFIDAAGEFFGPLGGKKGSDPVEFRFKSGAIIYTNHLGDKNAFEKYKGWGISRIGIEELTQVEEERSYLKLLGSLRAKRQIRIHGNKTFPALRSQIMSTTNPDGPGSFWVKKRFVHLLDSKGNPIPWNTPTRDPFTGLSRIFIPMSRKDNVYLRDDKQYEGMLLSQDEVTRRQWIDGSWTASGVYFTEWRPNGPAGTEEREKYPWAKHVVESAPLTPYAYRFGGGDWGYSHPSVFHKGCLSQDGRVHIYDELVLRQCGSFEMGVALANWWLPDLEQLPDKSVTIAFSPDAFSKTDASRTKAEQVADGIKSVLGPYGAFMLKYSDDERALMARDPKMAQMMFDRRRTEASQGQFCIVLKAAHTDRVAGWSYIRELLRFRPVVQETEAQLKERLMATFNRAGVESYERELSKVKRPDSQTLPRLQVWKSCTSAIRCMEEAMQKEEKPEDIQVFNAVDGVGGDDALDSCFIAGTMIETASGKVPIEDIRPGDLVYTRDGLKPVLAAGPTASEAEVLTLEMSNGRNLTGTPNHPIWVKNYGFKLLDSVRYGDILESWPSATVSFSTESPSGVTRKLSERTSETTIGRQGTIEGRTGEGSVLFTRKCGSPCMGLYRKVITSITWTKTRSTTTPIILRRSQESNIITTTPLPKKGGSACGEYNLSGSRKLDPGIALKLAPSGMRKTAGKLWLLARWLRKLANAALPRTKQNYSQYLGSAQKSAKLNGEETPASMTSQRTANFAGQNSGPTSFTESDSALVHAVRVGPTRAARVYNLSVAEKPEYYANGILVHNCRYTLMNFKEIEKVMPKSYFVADRMEKIQTQYETEIGERLIDPTRLAMVHQRQAAIYDNANPSAGRSFTPARASSGRHRGRVN